MASKGTFNQGWWNCFWSFAAELLSVDRFADRICIRVLEGAGITRKEAQYQLDNPQTENQAVQQVIREYWLHHAR